jgi:hypothetical protein
MRTQFILLAFCSLLALTNVADLDTKQKPLVPTDSAPIVYSESEEVEVYTADEEVQYGLCEPTEQELEEVADELREVSGDLNFNLIQYTNHSDYLPFDKRFEQWLNLRTEILETIGYQELLPFQTINRTDYTWKEANQSSYNSCATFGFTNAYQATVLYNIALESGQYHRDYNPMFLYKNTSGGSGGRTLMTVLKFNFSEGQSDVASVGFYPKLSGTDTRAQERCCNAVKLETAEQAMACLKAGIGVYIGNSTAVKACKQNSDGLRLAVIGGSWQHSTAFIGYVKINGNDYFLWRNSHGGRYTANDKLLTPTDCNWFDTQSIKTMLSSMNRYGGGFAILPESVP